MEIAILVTVEDETLEDPGHEMGITEDAYIALVDKLSAMGYTVNEVYAKKED